MLKLEIGERRGVFIGRDVKVTVLAVHVDDDDKATVELGFEAPGSVAISRDDYSFQQHLEFQVRREQGRKVGS